MYPKLSWIREDSKTKLLMGDGFIFECLNDRFFRFTSRDDDPRWVGSSAIDMSIDPGWGFFDPTLAGYVPDSITFTDEPEKESFTISLRGHKECLQCKNDLDLIGIWMEDQQAFRYELQMYFESDLEEFYLHSTRSMNGWKKDPTAPTCIEIIDFLPQYASWHDAIRLEEADVPRALYHCHVMSEDGVNWVKAPRVHSYDTEYLGDYENSLITMPTKFGKLGGQFGFVDREYGGWLLRPLEIPAPVSYQICWFYYDIHIQSPQAIPPRGSQERLQLRFRCEFMPIGAEKACAILDSAREYQWRDQEKYDIPVMEYENHFDKFLVDMPCEETSHMTFWRRSDSNCRVDREVGCGAPGSVSIERHNAGAKPSAWNTVAWGIPYDGKQIVGRRFRMSAMIKCENVTGRARVGVVSRYVVGDIFYGYLTHYDDGEPRSMGGSIGGVAPEEGMRDMHWVFSDSVKGTQDWTPVTVEFEIYGTLNCLFMEMYGDGKCWFDDVIIEDIGPARWENVTCYPQVEPSELRRKWEQKHGKK